MSDRAILHIDMNSFYASVECMMNPELKAHPIAVCGSQEDRHGIVLAKNYKAKAYCVSTGEVIWQAKQKCPDLVIVPPHYEEYMRFSKLAREIYGRYTDLVEAFGMDEVWADVTGCQRFIGTPLHIAEEIKETIKYELGLTVSIGVSFNKIFAKLGSDLKKPDAITVIPRESFGIFRHQICSESDARQKRSCLLSASEPSDNSHSFHPTFFREGSENVALIYGVLPMVLIHRLSRSGT